MTTSVKTLGLSHAAETWKTQMNVANLTNRTDAFSTRDRSLDTFAIAKDSFREAYMSHIQHVADSLPEGAVTAFLDKAYQSLDRIMEKTFDRRERALLGTGGHGKLAHRSMVKDANALALKSFTKIGKALLQDKATITQARELTHSKTPTSGVSQRPRLFITENGHINMVRTAPLPETLVFRGGGAKGIGNAPALLELEMTGALRNVKHVVGTSAGALTSLLLASGYDADRFSGFVKANPMSEVSDSVKGFSKMYPMVKLGGAAVVLHPLIRLFGGGSGERALQLLDQSSASRTSEYLKENWNSEAFQTKLLEIKAEFGEEAVERLASLKQDPDFKSDRTGSMITFKDLRILSKLAPGTFKELTLTGQDATNKSTSYFNADSNPDMPIAVAGRISMSIPVAFRAVRFDPGDGKGVRKWVDGGLGSNMPSEVVTRGKQGKELEDAQSKTLLFTYGEKGKWADKLHGSGQFKGSKSNFTGFFVGNNNWKQASKEDNERVYQGGINTYVVHHNDIDTMHLKASDERVEMAQAHSTLMMLKQIENRQDAMFSQTFGAVEDAVHYLSDEEKMHVLEAGPPKPEDYPGGKDDLRFKMESKLYDLVKLDLGADDDHPSQDIDHNQNKGKTSIEDID